MAELAYIVPGWIVALLIFLGVMIGFSAASIIWPAGWYVVVAYASIVLLIMCYAEATFIQHNYRPVLIES